MAVQPGDVEEIFDTDLSTSAIQTWINVAEDVVDDLDSRKFLTNEDRVTKILACHFAAAQDMRIASGSQGATSVNFQGRTGMKLNSTFYGQQVQLLAPQLEGTGPEMGAIFETIGTGEKS
jgi:hypothetical protein